MTRKIEFNVVPMPAPRMTQRDQWANCRSKRTQDYFDYKDALWREAKRSGFVLGNVLPMIVFCLPMPKSWSKKKKAAMYGQPHQSKGDTDNLIKGFKDALAKEDKHVWKYMGAEKRWSDEGKIILYIEE